MGDFMFDRYLIVNNNNQESLYLYINNYYEFSNDFNSSIKKNYDLKNLIKKYIRDKHIIFNGTKVFLVVAGIVISYVIIDNNVPLDKNWISDFEPIKEDEDKTETINDLIDTRSNINIPVRNYNSL